MPRPRTFTIGRSPECDVVLADDTVSRVHAELQCGPSDTLVLVDRHSTHGTHIVEGGTPRPCDRGAVRLDTVVRFGDVSITVAEIVSALHLKHPDADLPPVGPDGRKRAVPWADADRLVRCQCGTIKPGGGRCPGCGS